jgi:hypothetical protein
MDPSSARSKLAVRITQLVIIKAVLILASVGLLAFRASGPGIRGNSIALGMVGVIFSW